jgi:hypothetical protein
VLAFRTLKAFQIIAGANAPGTAIKIIPTLKGSHL